MKIKILYAVIITVSILFTMNYFTLFAIKLPHKAQVIYTWEYPDTFATAHWNYIILTDNQTEFYWPTVNTTYINGSWVVAENSSTGFIYEK